MRYIHDIEHSLCIYIENHIYEAHSINIWIFYPNNCFVTIQFHKYKLCVVWNCFRAKIISILQKILAFSLFKIVINHSYLDLNRGLSLNLWWLKNAKFTVECPMCGEAFLGKKCQQMVQTGLRERACVEKRVDVKDSLRLSGNEKNPLTTISK